jgi:F-type H+-transporting ATPase subunit delta
VSSQVSENNVVAVRYATALLDMAEEAKSTDAVEKDLLELEKMILASEDLQTLLQNPLMGHEKQEKALLAIADKAKFNKLTKNFLGVLAQNRRLSATVGIIGAIRKELYKRRGEIEAKVQTAYALTADQTKTLQQELTKVMGSNVTLEVEVDKDLLGGMIVTVGSTMIDDSVRRKLEKLGRAMGTSSNENIQLKEVG